MNPQETLEALAYAAIQTALNHYEREQFWSTVLRRMGNGVLVVDLQLHNLLDHLRSQF